MTIPGLVRTINAIGITHSWLDTFDKYMPYIETSILITIKRNLNHGIKIIWLIKDQ